MSTTELQSLLSTVETIRQTLAPTLSAELLQAIVEAEEGNPEDDVAAMRAIDRAVKTYLTGGE